MGKDIAILQCSQGTGMTLASFHWLLKEIQKNPGRVVYVNFELPKGQREIIENYATIKRLTAQKG